jgi:hypothetical protein
MGRGGTGKGLPKTLYLQRWKQAQAQRREKLVEALSSQTLNAKLLEELKIWRQNLEAKDAWLEARREHVRSVLQILERKIKESDS